MTPRALDGAPVRDRVDVLSRRPVPGLPGARRARRRRGDVLRRLAVLHGRGRGPDLARAPGARRGVVGRRDPVRRHACSSTSRPSARWTRRSRTRPTTRSSGARTPSGRSASWSRARSRTRSRRGRAGGLRAAAGLVGAGGQPPGLRPVRDRRRRRLRRPRERVDARPGGGELGDRGRGRVLPRLRRRHAAQRPHE